MAVFPMTRTLAPLLMAALAGAQDPIGATALVEDPAGDPAVGLELRWVARDPSRPHRLAAQTATTDAKGLARLRLDRPIAGPIQALVHDADAGLGAVLSLTRGDAQRVRLSPTGTARLVSESESDTAATITWALTASGQPLPLIEGRELHLPPGRYLGTVLEGRSFHACSFEVTAGRTANVEPTDRAETWRSETGWWVCPRGRAELSLNSSDAVGLPSHPEIRLDCWQERAGVVEVRPWPGDGPAPSLRRATFADAGPVVVVAPRPDGRGLTISGPANPVSIPADAERATLWSESVWHWPLELEPGTAPIEPSLPSSRSLMLTVTSPEGAPLADAAIAWHPVELTGDPIALRRRCRSIDPIATTVTDGRGIARIDHTAGVEGLLFVDHPTSRPHWIEVGDRDRLACQLDAGGSIRGRVEGGRGLGERGNVSGVRVWARSTDRGLLQPPRWADADADGRFTIRGLDPELAYTVTASLVRGAETYSARAVRVAADADEIALTLETEDPPLPGLGGNRDGRKGDR